MKRQVIFLLGLVVIVACKSDFDEVADTDQRSVKFIVNTSHIFDKVLSSHDGVFSLGYIKQIQPTHRLRVTGYCYDAGGQLVAKQTQYLERIEDANVVFKHLLKSQEFRFVFIADIVKYDATFNCYETWFQLKSETLGELYLVTLEEAEMPEYNVVYSNIINIVPDNQTTVVTLEPQTWNGYLCFTNTQGIDKLTGYYASYRSFFLESKKERGKQYAHSYDIVKEQSTNSTILLPLTVSLANDVITIASSITSLEDVKDTVFCFYNQEHTPFVITYDCQKHEISHDTY